MKSIFILLIAFICLGLIPRKYSAWVRLLVIGAAAVMVLYVTFG
jgi:membrane-bound ClpP family serine protease